MANNNKEKKRIKYKKLYKYYVDKPGIAWKIILSVILLIVYAFLTYFGNLQNAKLIVNELSTKQIIDIQGKLNVIGTINSVLLLVITVLLSSALASLFTIKERNHFYSDILSNDVFSSDDFIESLTEENKNLIYNNLSKSLSLENSKAKTRMFAHMRDKLNDSFNDGDYYYKECILDIKCDIYDNYIEKEIIKTIKILPISSGKPTNIKDLFIVSSKNIIKNNEEYGLFPDSVSVKINDNPVKKKDIHQQEGNISDFDKRNGVKEHSIFTCKKTINLPVNTPQRINIAYTSKVPIDDIVYVNRLSKACENFTFNFRINPKNGKNYSIDAAAFGFVDDGSNSPIHSDESGSVFIKFDNWLFPHDGVSITLIEKD